MYIFSAFFLPCSGFHLKLCLWHGPLSHWCREGKTLVVRPLKNCLPLFILVCLCVSSLVCLILTKTEKFFLSKYKIASFVYLCLSSADFRGGVDYPISNHYQELMVAFPNAKVRALFERQKLEELALHNLHSF